MKKGFTAVELMVTIMILMIIAVVAVPSFGSLSAKKKVQRVATRIVVYIEKLRICGAASSYSGASLVFDDKAQPATMYGICNGISVDSKLSLYTPFTYDPADVLNPSGVDISIYNDVYINILNSEDTQMNFPRSGMMNDDDRERVIIVSDNNDPQKSKHCCTITLNSLGIPVSECSEFGC